MGRAAVGERRMGEDGGMGGGYRWDKDEGAWRLEGGGNNGLHGGIVRLHQYPETPSRGESTLWIIYWRSR